MKRILLALVVLVITFSSCEGPTGPAGEGTNWFVDDFVVRANEWQPMDDGDGVYFMCEKDISALTPFIYNNGNVFAYRYIRPGQSNEVQTPLPFTLHLLEGKDYTWTETTYFDFLPESIAFYVQYSDFATNIEPGEQHFRVVLNW